MIIQSGFSLFHTADMARSLGPRQTMPTSSATIADSVSISHAARGAHVASNASSPPSSATINAYKSVDARLDAIKAKDAMNRSQEDWDYLFTKDQKLAEITTKVNQSPGSLTAEELDYNQKARGFVNTMANLSPAEKALHDKAVASGNIEAAEGIGQIAFIRMMGHTAGGANGSTYDPLNTEITVANIEKYFSHSIIDLTGKAQSQFQALIQYLQNNPAV